MTDAGKILMLIPARGGSKRLPRKNVLPLAGKPLICWTIEAALEAKLNARIMVTSDDEEILDIARQYEAEGIIVYRRPSELASDTASTVDVVIDAINEEKNNGHNPDSVILLQPTSPLRTPEDIMNTLSVFKEGGCRDTAVSICEVDHPVSWTGTLNNNSEFEWLVHRSQLRQEYKKGYRLNGAVYAFSADITSSNKTIYTAIVKASVMPKERSLDIDELLDFKICEMLLSEKCISSLNIHVV